MLKRIFPAQFNNLYRGQTVALWLFALITFLKVAIALVAIFYKDGGAQSSDGIPLNTFTSGGAAAVVHVIALLGLAKLLLGVLSVLALIRYRSMIPLLYLITVLDHIGRQWIGIMKPILRDGNATGEYVVWALSALSIIGFVLSITGKKYQQVKAE